MCSKKLAEHLRLSAASVQRAASRRDITYHRIKHRMFFELGKVLTATKV